MPCEHNKICRPYKEIWRCEGCAKDFIPKEPKQEPQCKSCFGDGKRWCNPKCYCECHKEPEEKRPEKKARVVLELFQQTATEDNVLLFDLGRCPFSAYDASTAAQAGKWAEEELRKRLGPPNPRDNFKTYRDEHGDIIACSFTEVMSKAKFKAEYPETYKRWFPDDL